jgi:hypothetical protein
MSLTTIRHPSESWGLRRHTRSLIARDPSFRWDDGKERKRV